VTICERTQYLLTRVISHSDRVNTDFTVGIMTSKSYAACGGSIVRVVVEAGICQYRYGGFV